MKDMTVIFLLICSSFCLNATEKSARINALTIAIAAKATGYNLRDTYHKGFLSQGNSTYVSTTLYRGSSYRLVAGGCADAYDVDILIYDENWNLVRKDTTRDKLAEIAITPRWSGTFHIKVRMYASTGNGAHWVLMYAYR